MSRGTADFADLPSLVDSDGDNPTPVAQSHVPSSSAAPSDSSDNSPPKCIIDVTFVGEGSEGLGERNKVYRMPIMRRFEEIFKKFTEAFGYDISKFTFRYNGEPLGEHETPASRGITGGSRAAKVTAMLDPMFARLSPQDYEADDDVLSAERRKPEGPLDPDYAGVPGLHSGSSSDDDDFSDRVRVVTDFAFGAKNNRNGNGDIPPILSDSEDDDDENFSVENSLSLSFEQQYAKLHPERFTRDQLEALDMTVEASRREHGKSIHSPGNFGEDYDSLPSLSSEEEEEEEEEEEDDDTENWMRASSFGGRGFFLDNEERLGGVRKKRMETAEEMRIKKLQQKEERERERAEKQRKIEYNREQRKLEKERKKAEREKKEKEEAELQKKKKAEAAERRRIEKEKTEKFLEEERKKNAAERARAAKEAKKKEEEEKMKAAEAIHQRNELVAKEAAKCRKENLEKAEKRLKEKKKKRINADELFGESMLADEQKKNKEKERKKKEKSRLQEEEKKREVAEEAELRKRLKEEEEAKRAQEAEEIAAKAEEERKRKKMEEDTIRAKASGPVSQFSNSKLHSTTNNCRSNVSSKSEALKMHDEIERQYTVENIRAPADSQAPISGGLSPVNPVTEEDCFLRYVSKNEANCFVFACNSNTQQVCLLENVFADFRDKFEATREIVTLSDCFPPKEVPDEDSAMKAFRNLCITPNPTGPSKLIKTPTILFLWNKSTNTIIGPFVAYSPSKLFAKGDPFIYVDDFEEFPCQIKVKGVLTKKNGMVIDTGIFKEGRIKDLDVLKGLSSYTSKYVMSATNANSAFDVVISATNANSTKVASQREHFNNISSISFSKTYFRKISESVFDSLDSFESLFSSIVKNCPIVVANSVSDRPVKKSKEFLMLASSTISHLSQAITIPCHEFIAVKTLEKVASYCDEIVAGQLQKGRFIIERLHKFHFPHFQYEREKRDAGKDLLETKREFRDLYRKDLEVLRQYANNASHESDFNFSADDKVVSCALRVFALEFVVIMTSFFNDKDRDLVLPANFVERPVSRLRRRAAERTLARVVSKIDDLWAPDRLGEGYTEEMNENVVTPVPYGSEDVEGCIFQVVEEPLNVYVLGSEESTLMLVLSDGKRSVYGLSNCEYIPACCSFVDVRLWKLDGQKRCIFVGAQHVFANVVSILHCQSYSTKYGEKVPPSFTVRCNNPSLLKTFPPFLPTDIKDPVAGFGDLAAKVDKWEDGIKSSYKEKMLAKESEDNDDESLDEDSSSDSDSSGEDGDDGFLVEPPRPILQEIKAPRNSQHPLMGMYEDRNGYIFHCNDNTYEACKNKKLFGGNGGRNGAYGSVSSGDILYLFNFSKQEITGPFSAVSGANCWDRDAWGGKFLTQVKIDTIFGYPPREAKCSLTKISNLVGHKKMKLNPGEQRLLTEKLTGCASSSRNSEVERARQERIERDNQRKLNQYREDLAVYHQKVYERDARRRLKEERSQNRKEEKRSIAEERAKARKERKETCATYLERFENCLTSASLELTIRSKEEGLGPTCVEIDGETSHRTRFRPMDREGRANFCAISKLYEYDISRVESSEDGRESCIPLPVLSTIRVLLTSIHNQEYLEEPLKAFMKSLDNYLKDDPFAQRAVLGFVLTFGIFDELELEYDKKRVTFEDKVSDFMAVGEDAMDQKKFMKTWKRISWFFENKVKFPIPKPALSQVSTIDLEFEDKALEAGMECPISNEIFKDPVTIEGDVSGMIFERELIRDWLSKRGTNPITHRKLPSDWKLISNKKKKREVEEWKERGREKNKEVGNAGSSLESLIKIKDSLSRPNADVGVGASATDLDSMTDKLSEINQLMNLGASNPDESGPQLETEPESQPEDDIIRLNKEIAKNYEGDEHPVTATKRHEEFNVMKENLKRELLQEHYKGGILDGPRFAKDNVERAQNMDRLVKEVLNQYIFTAAPEFRKQQTSGRKDPNSDYVIPFLGTDKTLEIFIKLAEGQSKWSPCMKNRDDALAFAEAFAEAVQSCSRKISRVAARMRNDFTHLSITDLHLGMVEKEMGGYVIIEFGNHRQFDTNFKDEIPSVRVFKTHFNKLRDAYIQYQMSSKPRFIDQRLGSFRCRLFTLAKRYDLFGVMKGGYHSSITRETLNVLKGRFGVTHECFASPFNSNSKTYNSIFYESDFCFGSYGSFYDFHPKEGSYEVNPPFDRFSIEKMLQHVYELLRCSDDTLPLSFVVIVPKVSEVSAALSGRVVKDYDYMFFPKYVTKEYVWSNAYFYKGMQHTTDRKIGGSTSFKYVSWKSEHLTHVIFLQNAAGRIKWEVNPENAKELEEAFTTEPDEFVFQQSITNLSEEIQEEIQNEEVKKRGEMKKGGGLGPGGLTGGALGVGYGLSAETKQQHKPGPQMYPPLQSSRNLPRQQPPDTTRGVSISAYTNSEQRSKGAPSNPRSYEAPPF